MRIATTQKGRYPMTTIAERNEFLASVADVLELVTSERWTPEYAEECIRAAVMRVYDDHP